MNRLKVKKNNDMRKKIVLYGLIGTFVLFFGMTACVPDYETDFEVKSLVVPDRSLIPVTFPIEGGKSVAEVQTNVDFKNWTATSNAEWLKVEKQEKQVVISAGMNDAFTPRVGNVTIAYGHQSYTIDVLQAGKLPSMLVDGQKSEVYRSVSARDTTISVVVKSNMTLDHILIPDSANFVHVESITDVTGSTDEKLVTFMVDRNIARKPRYCTVTFQSSENHEQTASFVVVQAEMRFVEIPLRVDMLSTNATEPKEGPIQNLVDGRSDTYFHSLYSSTINEMHYFQVNLDAPIDGFIFWYQNRNNNNGKPTNVSIMVSEDGENWVEVKRYTSNMPTGAASTFESEFIDAGMKFSYFRFVVNATNGAAGPTYFNMAEFKMFRME